MVNMCTSKLFGATYYKVSLQKTCQHDLNNIQAWLFFGVLFFFNHVPVSMYRVTLEGPLKFM